MATEGPGGLQLCVWVQVVVALLKNSSKLSGISGWEKSSWQGRSAPSSIVAENVCREQISPPVVNGQVAQERCLKREREVKESRACLKDVP
ncbi:hypothetical protein Zm00014a_029597 [Zea mays]|uniref:Uncharacterized protein n=2 Tax=Zea mays TaxID=4577 RepID=A0A3L6EAK0_MAIZE|nr:hypothetical protein ZEAMMB73_Zm00001d038575 [Zea mays]PWZ17974.1 hypothetical protein Zm00014a_029597 [Zea mays]